MVKLKDLFKGDKRIKIVVEDEDYKQFLEYAKRQGCLWRSGEVIKPNVSKPNGYTKTIVITKDLLMYRPTSWISQMSLQNSSEYLFTNLKEEKLIDEHIERSLRTEKINKEFELADQVRLIAYKHKCEENRRISQLQLKYQNVTCKLQNNFFVRYENDDELLRLFLLFKKYGYENIFDIALEKFTKDPKVICVNNQEMTFYPADIAICSCGLLANKKFYKTDNFEKMIEDIFKD